MHYRKIHKDGSASGGPMYYIEKGLGKSWKPLAIAFAVCTVISSFGSGNSVQAFTVADQIRNDLAIPTFVTGLVMATLVALVILGGIKRIGQVTSKLLPGMAVIYLLGGLFILISNAGEVPAVLMMIVRDAFTPAAQIGGFAGGTFIFMLTWGVKRGLFSNESGQGSAPIAHAAAKTKEPVREGIVAMIGPFIDTLIICTMTGLIILTTGVWKDRLPDSVRITRQAAIKVVKSKTQVMPNGIIEKKNVLEDGFFEVKDGIPGSVDFIRNHSKVTSPLIFKGKELFDGKIAMKNGEMVLPQKISLTLKGNMLQNGSPLTSAGFKKGLSPLGNWGHFIVTISVFLFALSTAISWSYYGDRACVYIFGKKGVLPYKIIYVLIHFFGAVFPLEAVWGFGDAALGLMAFPNLIAIILLLPTVKKITKEYISREHIPYKKLAK
jgi:AGCS family alanine or glycine:cation symporter